MTQKIFITVYLKTDSVCDLSSFPAGTVTCKGTYLYNCSYSMTSFELVMMQDALGNADMNHCWLVQCGPNAPPLAAAVAAVVAKD